MRQNPQGRALGTRSPAHTLGHTAPQDEVVLAVASRPPNDGEYTVQYEGSSFKGQRHLRFTVGWREFIRKEGVEVGACKGAWLP